MKGVFRCGEDVHIRPATKEELEYCTQKLEELKEKYKI